MDSSGSSGSLHGFAELWAAEQPKPLPSGLSSLSPSLDIGPAWPQQLSQPGLAPRLVSPNQAFPQLSLVHLIPPWQLLLERAN